MELFILFGLILLNGLFSMSEIALVSARKSRLEALARRGNRSAAKALQLAKSPNTFLSTVQIGITVIGIITGIYSGENITDDFQLWLSSYPVLDPYKEELAIGVVVVLITYFSLVLGELVPKRIGMSRPEGIALAVAPLMQFLAKVSRPFIWLLTLSTELLLKIFGKEVSDQQHLTEEEIKAVIQESVMTGEVQEIEQDIVERAFGLGDLRVSSLMTHRQDLVCIDLGDTASGIRQLVHRDLHSYYPVINASFDELLGVIALKDLFVAESNFSAEQLKQLIRQPNFFPENLTAYSALEQFRKKRIHYALVLDEYGVFQGMITINDILEALVGDIGEEDDEYQMTSIGNNEWVVDGQYPFFEFINTLELDGPVEKELPFNTVAGLVLHELERFPEQGEIVVWSHLKLEVTEMTAMRIVKIKVTRIPVSQE